jgi:hypothetical protein
MADCIKFEVYIPVYFQKGRTVHATDEKLLEEFIHETNSKYNGITQSNPIGGAAFKGWWKSGGIHVDHLTCFFGLIQVPKHDEAVGYFQGWKDKFEKRLNCEPASAAPVSSLRSTSTFTMIFFLTMGTR